jgi:hypothetical protein
LLRLLKKRKKEQKLKIMGVSVDSSSYFQRLSLCETIQRTATIIASDFCVFAQLGFLTVGPFMFAWAGLLLVLMPALGLDANQINDPAYLIDGHLGPFYAMLFINLLVFLFTTVVGTGALLRAVAELYLHRRPSVKACIQVGFRRSVVMITTSILVLMGTLVGCLFFILPGYYAMVNWFLVQPVIIIGKYCTDSQIRYRTTILLLHQHKRLISHINS